MSRKLMALTSAGMVAVFAAIASTQGPPPGRGFGPPPEGPPLAGLLNIPEIRDELRLTADQDDKLEALRRSGELEFGPPPGFGPPGFGPPGFGPPGFGPAGFGGPPGFGPPGFGPPGFGPPGGEDRKVVAEFDKDGNGWLNAAERDAARQFVKSDQANRGRGGPPAGPPGGPRGGRGGPGFGPPPGREAEPGRPGPRVSPDEVSPVVGPSLYDPTVLRTLFFEFDNDDWEAELEDFHGTDVEVPATLIVDGKKHPNVGVKFRGNSSYMMVPRGSKRSLNVSLDLANADQRLYGYKTLNLLNAHEDDSLLHTVLYSHIARQYMAAPKANLVKVVVNGESWGIYSNAQQFDKIFLQENYGTSKGTRWKVSGNPGGGGGLEYQGENLAPYQRRYEMKSEDSDKVWRELVKLCRVLNETPLDQLEAALAPLLDTEGVLWFLALDNTLVNGDGYWIRASDYSLFRDERGKFHIAPHDMNEAFQPPMGPGFGPPGGRGGPGPGGPGRGGPGPGGFAGPPGGPDGPRFGPPPRGLDVLMPRGERRGSGFDLDPLIGLDDATKPLRSRLLAVPSLRAKYLQHVRMIAKESLDWRTLGPVVKQLAALIDDEVEADTRKLSSLEAFRQAVAEAPPAQETRGPRRASLALFAHGRREYLLNYRETKQLPSP